MTGKTLKHFAIALSLSNLLLLKGWLELLEGVRHPYFRQEISRYWVDCAALMLTVLLGAGIFFLAVWVAGRSEKWLPRRLVRGAFLVANVVLFFMVLNVLRRQYPSFSLEALADRWGIPALVAGILASAGLAVYLWQRFRPPLVSVACHVLLLCSPFAVVTFSKAVWLGLDQTPGGASVKSTSNLENPSPAAQGGRVIWFLFDALDYRLAFEERSANLELPEFDRLRNEMFWATEARAPARVTGRSLPALLTGRLVSKAIPSGRAELMITFAGAKEPVGWSQQPGIFSWTREAGMGTALIGWYHPYCRVFADSLTWCAWMPFRAGKARYPILQSMGEFIRQATPPMFRFNFPAFLQLNDPQGGAEYHILTYRRTFDDAKRIVTDARYSLVLVHWPIPHGPFIYDRQRREFSTTPHPQEGYLDNLFLADQTLGEMRRALETAGLWESTALLVSSDHPWSGSKSIDGKRDPRIPFMLKLPGRHVTQTYDRVFNTVLTPELLWELLQGNLSAPEDVAEWLDRRIDTKNSRVQRK